MQTLSPILKMGFLFSDSGLLYRLDKKSEVFTFYGIKSIKQFLRQISVVTNWVNLWMYLYPLSSM